GKCISGAQSFVLDSAISSRLKLSTVTRCSLHRSPKRSSRSPKPVLRSDRLNVESSSGSAERRENRRGKAYAGNAPTTPCSADGRVFPEAGTQIGRIHG